MPPKRKYHSIFFESDNEKPKSKPKPKPVKEVLSLLHLEEDDYGDHICYYVLGNSGKIYAIFLFNGSRSSSCNCPAFKHRKRECKHICYVVEKNDNSSDFSQMQIKAKDLLKESKLHRYNYSFLEYIIREGYDTTVYPDIYELLNKYPKPEENNSD